MPGRLQKMPCIPWERKEVSELRDMIRQILLEELSRRDNRIGPSTEEMVSIGSSADLNAFALRLLKNSHLEQLRDRIKSGRHRFVLAPQHTGHVPVHAHKPHTPPPHAATEAQFRRGLITEREITNLAAGTRTLVVDKSVRLTPLARDELTSRGITLERKNL